MEVFSCEDQKREPTFIEHLTKALLSVDPSGRNSVKFFEGEAESSF